MKLAMHLILSRVSFCRRENKKLGITSVVHVNDPRFRHIEMVRVHSSMNLGCGRDFTIGTALISVHTNLRILLQDSTMLTHRCI